MKNPKSENSISGCKHIQFSDGNRFLHKKNICMQKIENFLLNRLFEGEFDYNLVSYMNIDFSNLI